MYVVISLICFPTADGSLTEGYLFDDRMTTCVKQRYRSILGSQEPTVLETCMLNGNNVHFEHWPSSLN